MDSGGSAGMHACAISLSIGESCEYDQGCENMIRESQLSTSGNPRNSEIRGQIESTESLQAMEFWYRFKGIKRMRLNNENDGGTACMGDYMSLGLEDECRLRLSLGRTSGTDLTTTLGRTSGIDPTVSLGHAYGIDTFACPGYTTCIDHIAGLGHTAIMDRAASLGHTINLSDSAISAGSWTSIGSVPLPIKDLEKAGLSEVELGLGLTRKPVISGAGSALTSVHHHSSYPNITHIDRSGENSFAEHVQTTSVMVEDIQRKGFCMENGLEAQPQFGVSRNSAGVAKSDQVSSLPFLHQDCRSQTAYSEGIPMIDEGSTSNGGYILPLLMGHQFGRVPSSKAERFQPGVVAITEAAPEADISMSLRASSGTTSTSGASSGLADRAPKMCRFTGCGKRARGASGLCISHGGGRRCQKQGCNNGAEGRTIFCKAHGGGRRCENLGCTKSAEGKTDYCIGHGGGSRCSHDGCAKAARGRTGLCIRHGGGKRCQREGCTKSAEGYTALCISHGGGRRCQYPNCGKGAQGSTMFCKAHGGGKRCIVEGCNKGAEGSTPLCKGHGGGKRCMFDDRGVCPKSAHGGTAYCVAHGGGKRCVVQGCTKSARGRTDCCVRHGGGKRCKSENCSKSAQGSTDFCKAHGGGKRCSWGQEGSTHSGESFQDETWDFFKSSCDRYAKGNLGLCAAHSALVQDQRVHGTGTFRSTFPVGIETSPLSGQVPGSMHKEENFLSSFNASKQFGNGIEDDLENSSESEGSESPSESPLQANTSSGTSRGEQDGMEEDTCHHPQLALFQSTIAVGASQSLTFDSSMAFGITKQTSETGSRFQPFISSQVFRNQSMQRHASGRKQELRQKGPSNLEDDGIFNMSSLSLPDERVHGGNIMALLSGEASK